MHQGRTSCKLVNARTPSALSSSPSLDATAATTCGRLGGVVIRSREEAVRRERGGARPVGAGQAYRHGTLAGEVEAAVLFYTSAECTGASSVVSGALRWAIHRLRARSTPRVSSNTHPTRSPPPPFSQIKGMRGTHGGDDCVSTSLRAHGTKPGRVASPDDVRSGMLRRRVPGHVVQLLHQPGIAQLLRHGSEASLGQAELEDDLFWNSKRPLR